MSIRSLLDNWPSVDDLASDMDVPPNTAKKWKTRDRLPNKYWDTLLRAAKRRGYKITAEDLVVASKRAA